MKKSISLLLTLFFAISFAFGQSVDLNQNLPLDPNVKIGKLSNGLTYYIRKNSKPEKRVEMNIVLKVGSLMEDDNQQGLAHFTEHMCFNGTKMFPGNSMIKYFESKGIVFGRQLNAFTSYDMTVYQLTVPTDSQDVFNKGFMMLNDWMQHVTFDSTEVEKERGVIVEEWRLGQGASERERMVYEPILYKNSRYAERFIIGKKEIIETFKQETLRKFYKDWYRPELMAVVFVGDIDVDKIEAMIKETYSKIPTVANPRPLIDYPVPDNEEPMFVSVRDKEENSTNIQIIYKQPTEETKTIKDYRRNIVYSFVNSMLNSRIYELSLVENPPFIRASSSYGQLVKTKNMFQTYIKVKDDGILKGLETVTTENEKARRYGFTQTELDRQKMSALRNMESALAEKDKTESSSYLWEYISNFLQNDPMMGIENEAKLYKDIIPTITLDEVNSVIGKFITDGKNMVVIITAPEKESVKLPTEKEVFDVLKKVKKSKIKKFKDDISDKPFLAKKPNGGKIIEEKVNKDLNITEWKLSNGVTVILKPTDFKNDQIMFTSFKWGGTSVYGEKDYRTATYASKLIDDGGIGEMNQIQLQKFMKGKMFGATPYISELTEGLNGECSPKDFETMLQYIYLFYTAPRKDETVFKSFVEKMKSQIANRDAQPFTALSDTMGQIMSQKHYTSRPLTLKTIDEINLDRAFEIFKEKFTNAKDMEFVMVGKFNPSEIKPLVEQYLGGLPSVDKKTTWKDIGRRATKGNIQKNVYKGVAPQSVVVLMFHGDFDYNIKNEASFNAMIAMLNIKMEEVIREEASGVYGISVFGSVERIPVPKYSIMVYFGCNPDRVDELIKTFNAEIEKIKASGIDDSYLQKVKKQIKRQKETDMKENSFWMGTILDARMNNIDINEAINPDKFVDQMNIAEANLLIKKYFNYTNYARFVLYPAEMEPVR